MITNRNIDRELFSLFMKQSWLNDHEENTRALLNLASDEEQRKLLIELLTNFEYLTSDRIESLVTKQAERICKNLGVVPDVSQIITTAFDSEPDSSQLLISMLRPKLPGFGGANFALKSKGMEAIRKIEARPTIIIVDEFSGTGNTIISRVNSFAKQASEFCKQKNVKIDLKIIVCLLTCMKPALLKIAGAGIEVYAELEMPAGISGRYEASVVGAKLALMRLIETKLDNKRMNPFPSLGYGEAEAIFAMKHSNVPNSNFPILWWRHLADKTPFKPLLERHEPAYEY